MHLVKLQNVKTIKLREQVKRNTNRFPNHFMFQLTEFEKDELVANCDHLKNLKFSKSLPFVFTEHGILMLSSVLNTERAVTLSIKIIEEFIEMREYLIQNLSLRNKIEKIRKKLSNHYKNIELVFNYLNKLMEKQENPKPRKKIGYK